MIHGKRWTFVKHKCRCDACIAANAAYMGAYREKNKAKILAKEKERYRREAEKIIDRMGAYYQRERETILERQKLPAALLRRRTNQQNREARKRGRFVENVDHATVFVRDKGICGICNEPIVGAFDIDHIVLVSHGGEHSYANVRVAHPSCNRKRARRH